MGQIEIKLSDLTDGKTVQKTYNLRGDEPPVIINGKEMIDEEFDRGEIELRLRWAERVFEDDQVKV